MVRGAWCVEAHDCSPIERTQTAHLRRAQELDGAFGPVLRAGHFGQANEAHRHPLLVPQLAAQRQALGFVAYLDQGRFADSYAYTGMLIRTQLDRDAFSTQIQKTRVGTGALQSRELIDASYALSDRIFQLDRAIEVVLDQALATDNPVGAQVTRLEEAFSKPPRHFAGR